jgi:virulence-associated protein VapD
MDTEIFQHFLFFHIFESIQGVFYLSQVGEHSLAGSLRIVIFYSGENFMVPLARLG